MFTEQPNLTIVLAMQILISKKSGICFTHSTYCVVFCVLLFSTVTVWWLNLAQYSPF